MSTVTIYARVPEAVKAATDAYADEHGMTLASAVADLLGRGLEAAVNEESVAALEANVQRLQSELGQVRPALDAVQDRLSQVLGQCRCGQKLTGHDLLVKGVCASCKTGVSGALTGAVPEGAKVNTNDLIPLLAGVGVALAVILLAYKASQ